MRRPGLLLGTWSWGARGWEPNRRGTYAAVVVLEDADDIISEGLVSLIHGKQMARVARVARCAPPLEAFGDLGKEGPVFAWCPPRTLRADDE